MEIEKEKFRTDLATLAEGIVSESETEDEQVEDQVNRVSITTQPDSDETDEWEMTLTIDGQPVVPPNDVIQRAKSIVQDFGEIPEDYLVPAGDGQYRQDSQVEEDRHEKANSEAEETYFYDEWDYRRRHYRKKLVRFKRT